MEIENENQNNNDWTPEYESLIKDIKKRREEIKRKREERNNPFSHIAMPMVMKVAAQTIGLDLVAVKPMSSPNISLLYPTYTYEDPKAKYKKRKKVIEKLLGIENTEDEAETHFTLPYGEIDHPDTTNFKIEVKEIEESAASKIYNKWSPIIDKLGISDEKRNWLNDYCNMHSSSGFSI